jgi:hypothetical protein
MSAEVMSFFSRQLKLESETNVGLLQLRQQLLTISSPIQEEQVQMHALSQRIKRRQIWTAVTAQNRRISQKTQAA